MDKAVKLNVLEVMPHIQREGVMKKTLIALTTMAVTGFCAVTLADEAKTSPVIMTDDEMDSIVGAGSLTVSPAVPFLTGNGMVNPAGPIATNRTVEVNDNAAGGLNKAANGPGIEVFNPG